MAQSRLLSSAGVRLRMNALLKFAGGSMIFTGLRAGSLELIEREGKGRSGREAGNACWREGKVRGCADAASGEDTRGRDATGLKGEGTGATAVMTAGGEKLSACNDDADGRELTHSGCCRDRDFLCGLVEDGRAWQGMRGGRRVRGEIGWGI